MMSAPGEIGPPATVIYIAGYGRSGSTLLERVLAAHPGIEGLGEVEHLCRADDLHAVNCGCGEPIDSCELWGPVVEALASEFDFGRVRGLQDAADAWEPGRLGAAAGNKRSGNPCARDARETARESARGVSAGTGAARDSANGGEYGAYDRFNARLFGELTARLDGPRYLIDSSKTARLNALRPFSLVRAGLGVRLVHLVRDGRGCMWSYISKGSNRRLEQGRRGASARVRFAGLRSALSWRLANRAAEQFGAVYPDSYMRVRYEDFVSDPRSALEELGSFLSTDLSEQIEALESGGALPRVHQVAGNRMRGEDVIRLRADTAWESELPARHRALFRLVNGRMARGYGYGRDTSVI